MRAPLSWLRDFAPFPNDVGVLRDALDDLGLVVEAIERVGEGLSDVVVSRVVEIRPIEGADKIRLVLVDAGAEPLEIVCGAHNFSVGDRVPLAPVGAILPGGFEIARRKMRGIWSNGMLCSGRELGLSDDGAGLLILGDDAPGEPGTPLMEALGLEPDVVFDLAVEGNRPDAWCMTGVARDLAGRLGLPCSVPEPPEPEPSGRPVESLASASVDSPDLCPRLTVSVLSDVVVGASPSWLARRLLLAGMRPINNVVDASNYVMLELGQPTHPYDLAKLPGRGLSVRRARPGETLQTLDGVERSVGVRGRSLGDTGEDCLICDAEGTPVGIGGIMGGASSEIERSTTEVLLEAAYFTPMAIARTSKRLGVRTEASARFERGCDPWAIEPSVRRFCQLVAESVPGLRVADGVLDVRAEVPEPFVVRVPLEHVHRQIGVSLGATDVARLLEPIGFTVLEDDGETLTVEVPTNRPDVRLEPYGVDDVVEEIARTLGYSNVPRRIPTWPQPGGLNPRQRAAADAQGHPGRPRCIGGMDGHLRPRRRARHGGPVRRRRAGGQPARRREALPASFAHARSPGGAGAQRGAPPGRDPPLRGGRGLLAPRRWRATGGRTGRRRRHRTRRAAREREVLSAVFALEDDDARTAVAAWQALAGAFAVEGVRLVSLERGGTALPGLHPTRAAHLVVYPPAGQDGGGDAHAVIGAVGEIDPGVASSFELVGVSGSPRRIGWLEVDLGVLFDESLVPRRRTVGGAVSRFPSSDVDLAFVVAERHGADEVGEVLRVAAGELLESVRLFDVYRGPGIDDGPRSLAYRLRFCSSERTLTDAEVGERRARCIEAVETEFGAVLR